MGIPGVARLAKRAQAEMLAYLPTVVDHNITLSSVELSYSGKVQSPWLMLNAAT